MKIYFTCLIQRLEILKIVSSPAPLVCRPPRGFIRLESELQTNKTDRQKDTQTDRQTRRQTALHPLFIFHLYKLAKRERTFILSK